MLAPLTSQRSCRYAARTDVTKLPVTARPGVDPEVARELEGALQDIGTLHQLLSWGSQQEPPVGLEEVLAQDEYTHDVLVPWRDGQWLVFDCT